jgi:flagellar basal body-associated protein FliL
MPEEDNNRKDRPKRGCVITLILPLAILAAIGIWFLARRGEEPAVEANGETRIQSTLHLETFVLNLADSDQRAYLRVGIDLGLSKPARTGEGAVPIAQVRDTILTVLSQAKGDELLTAPGKAKLKQDLLRALEERVPQLGVEDVYFTEFLIQR